MVWLCHRKIAGTVFTSCSGHSHNTYIFVSVFTMFRTSTDEENAALVHFGRSAGDARPTADEPQRWRNEFVPLQTETMRSFCKLKLFQDTVGPESPLRLLETQTEVVAPREWPSRDRSHCIKVYKERLITSKLQYKGMASSCDCISHLKLSKKCMHSAARSDATHCSSNGSTNMHQQLSAATATKMNASFRSLASHAG